MSASFFVCVLLLAPANFGLSFVVAALIVNPICMCLMYKGYFKKDVVKELLFIVYFVAVVIDGENLE